MTRSPIWNKIDNMAPAWRMPSSTTVRALGAWSGVFVVGALYMTQPWDYLRSLVNSSNEV